MRHFVYTKSDSYKVCILVNNIQLQEIEEEYIQYLPVNKEDILIMDLYRDSGKKTKVSAIKEYLKEIIPILKDFNVQHILICNGPYFKVLTKQPKVDVNIGYIFNVEGMNVSYVPDFRSIFVNPDIVRSKIKRGIEALADKIQGSYQAPGSIQFNAEYPSTPEQIKKALQKLLKYSSLTCDIETYDLKVYKAKLASIAFAVDEQNGIAFKIDSSKVKYNFEVRKLLREFFHTYQGKLIFHNIAYDASVLIYELYMDDVTDSEGVLYGINDLLVNFEDTKLIAYLALNSCAGNELGLKVLAQEFAGNYGQENINDVSLIPDEQLLEYNLKDCLCTWYVYNKYRPMMVKDQQEDVYNNIFLKATVDIIQMQLTGFPLDMERVHEVDKILQNDKEKALKDIMSTSIISNFIDVLKQQWVEAKNAKLKVKRVTIEDADVEFNPRSHKQLQELLYSTLHLPILGKTKTGAPSVDTATLGALQHHTKDPEILQILQGLVDFNAVDKILSSFIPAFKDACYSPKQNWYYLLGKFNLGGTVSGRLSSNDPNLQNIPATGSKYAKLIKSCFKAPKGWLLCGLDFNALEDHISALTTKDPNKLKVYLEHYDGHCLRAYTYFKDKMPLITAKLDEVDQDGNVYKVTYDSGEYTFYNEYNPEFIKLKEN